MVLDSSLIVMFLDSASTPTPDRGSEQEGQPTRKRKTGNADASAKGTPRLST